MKLVRSSKCAVVLVVSWMGMAWADDFEQRAREAAIAVDRELVRVADPWHAVEPKRVAGRPEVAEYRLALVHDALPLRCTGFGSEPTVVRVELATRALVVPLDVAALHGLAAYMTKTFPVARDVAVAALPPGAAPTVGEATLFMPSGVSDSWTLSLHRGTSAWTVRVDVPAGRLRSVEPQRTK